MLEQFKFKPVDPNVTKHHLEQRGFVTVPFDYEKPDGEKISIFYRLIPAFGSTPDDRSKPIIVVINGGPGISSSAYRALDFDYNDAEAPQNGPLNRFKYFLKTHRVLIADQRGTDGQSAPLDMDDRNLNPDLISKYFSSNHQAKDYLAVIEEVIPKDEEFLMIAQSYGGMVGMQYLTLSQMRKPKGIIFSCSALPYENMQEAMESRRKEQLKLNLELKAACPEIADRVQLVRSYLEKHSIDPNLVNGLYGMLGKNIKGVWEKELVLHLDKLLKMDKAELEKEFKSHHGTGNFLNYILSSCNFTPGHTDRTIGRELLKKIPFEPWMIDENLIMIQIGVGVDYQEKIADRMDAKPPLPTPFASVEEIRKSIAVNQLLFTPAENDAFVPAENYLNEIEKFMVKGHTQVKHLPGGHHAIFLEKGYEALLEWSKNL